MSSTGTDALQAQFEAARCEAVALSDHYENLETDDPERPGAWGRVVEQTKRAQQYLEAWLQADALAEDAPERELSLV